MDVDRRGFKSGIDQIIISISCISSKSRDPLNWGSLDFTGKSLPRRGFKRYWQLAIILAAGYSSSLSLSLMISLPLIYILLLSTGLMIVFYALLSWQSYVERERFTEQLRPFISSQQLYDRLVSGQEALVSSDIQQPFEALCKDFLDAQSAILVPFGSLATMFGPAVTYPPNNEFSLDQLEKIADSIRDPSVLCHALDPDDFENLFWAVPLWNVSGLSGVLLLGWKTDQAPYTQEEIEIARATGERLIDIQASAEIAQRLMALQREQMVESQVIDRRTRLILHDDILPHLHTIILDINSQEFGEKQNAMEIVNSLTNIHHQITDLLQVMPAIKRSDVGRLGLKAALEKLINLELKGAFDQVKWQINQEAEQKVRELPPLTTEILFYAIREAIRNAAQHARNPQDENPIQLIITFDSGVNLVVVVEDTGVGLDDSRQQERAGGKGLALHSTMLSVVGGSLSVESISGISTKVFITLPV